MIIITKASKVEKINGDIFKILSVNPADRPAVKYDSDSVEVYAMPQLAPTIELLADRDKGDISKKKFVKKYIKYLKDDSDAENIIRSIGLSLKDNNSLCFVCDDDIFRYYIKTLVTYITDLFGTECRTYSEFKEEYDELTSNLSKKERKLMKAEIDELSETKKEVREKLAKKIRKGISGMSDEGLSMVEEMSKKYIINDLIMKFVRDDVCKLSDKGVTNINPNNLGKMKKNINAVLAAADANKKIGSVIKSIAKSHDVKLSKKGLEKLNKVSFVALVGEMASAVCEYRDGNNK